MAPFLRIGFSNFEIDPGLAYHEEVLNPYCAVYMKEAVETGESCLRISIIEQKTNLIQITPEPNIKALLTWSQMHPNV